MSKDRQITYSLIIPLTDDERLSAGPDLPKIEVDIPSSQSKEILKETGMTLVRLAVEAGISNYPPFIENGAGAVAVWEREKDQDTSSGVYLSDFDDYQGRILYNEPEKISTWIHAHKLVAVTVFRELMNLHQPSSV